MVRFATGDSKLRKAHLIVIKGKLLLRHLQKGKQNHRGWPGDHLQVVETVKSQHLNVIGVNSVTVLHFSD